MLLQALELFGLSVPILLLLAGAGLMVAEALAPGAHFLVVGIALLIAGVVGLALGPVVGPTLALFAMVLAVVLAGGATLYAYREFNLYGGSGAGKTSDSAALRGKTGRVTERVTTDGGTVKLDDGGFNPNYRAHTVDGVIEEGTEVIVVDPGGGNVLTVESLDGGMDAIDRELARERQRRDHSARSADGETGEDTGTERETA